MPDRPYTLLSCCVSIDGYIDSASPRRLELSNSADFDRVDSVRATCDAIMVGAATVRTDNPRLLVRSKSRREHRVAKGLPPSPIKVTVSERLELDPCADFFTAGESEKLVYCATTRIREAHARLGGVATIVDGGEPVEMRRVSEDLAARGVQRLMVEGGGKVHTQFLTEGLADELQLVVAPFFVGDSQAARFVHDGRFPWNPGRRATLAEVRQIGDVVLLRYALSPRFRADCPTVAVPPPLPAATIRSQVPVPLQFADGYRAAARAFSFDGLVDGHEHIAFGLGDRAAAVTSAGGQPPPLVRLHSECLTGDVFGSQRCDCGAQVREAVERIADSGGFLLYLRQEGRGIGLYAKLEAYGLQDGGLDTYQANLALGHREDERSYLAAAQMLHALGVRQIALLSNNPDKAQQLQRFGVRVTELVPTAVHLSEANARYLATKAQRGAHTLDIPLSAG
jgi:5-amino-6-(5-phosphoribosylamino)uracil reductase